MTETCEKAVPCPLDHVDRQFHALVIDAYARRIVGYGTADGQTRAAGYRLTTSTVISLD